MTVRELKEWLEQFNEDERVQAFEDILTNEVEIVVNDEGIIVK